MNWQQVFLLYKKELLEFVRDRRTFMIMLLVPALLYPGLIIVTSELAAKQMATQAKKSYIVGVKKGYENSPLVKKISEVKNFTILSQQKPDFEKAHVFIEPSDKYQKQLEALDSAGLKIYYQTADNSSRYVYGEVYDLIDEYSRELVKKRLLELGIKDGFVQPFNILVEKVDKDVEGRFIAGRILPGIMLIMLVVGCAFIGQEIGAGEKERGTLETILCSPLSRLELVCGKYLTVATVGLVSAVINLVCMGLTFSLMTKMMAQGENSPFAGFSIPLAAIPAIFLCLVMVAFLVSGLTLIASSLARTVQEASQYMIPITLFLSLPVIFSSLPGVEFEGMTRFVPFLNFCLIFQNLLIMKATFIDVFYVMFSTAIFAALVVFVLIKIYNSESALFNHEGRSVFSFKRSLMRGKNSPETSDSIICFLIMLPLMFFVSTSLQQIGLRESIIISQWGLFFLCSLGFMVYFKINIRECLTLHNPGARNLIVCFLLTPFCFSGVVLLSLLLHRMGLSAPEVETVDLMASLTNNYGFLGSLLLISVTPAICEEVFFRGLVLSGLRREYSPKACILIQALMFGVAHFSLFRFAGTAIMGAALTLVLFRTRSLICTIMMHMIFNGLSCILWAHGFAEEKAFEAVFSEWKYFIIFGTLTGLSLFFVLKPKEVPAEQLV